MMPLGINDAVENVILLLQFTIVFVNNTGLAYRSLTVAQRQVLSRFKKTKQTFEWREILITLQFCWSCHFYLV